MGLMRALCTLAFSHSTIVHKPVTEIISVFHLASNGLTLSTNSLLTKALKRFERKRSSYSLQKRKYKKNDYG
jgi:hypothetical protein